MSLVTNLEIRQPEVISEIFRLRQNKVSFNKIKELISQKFGINVDKLTVRKVFYNELHKSSDNPVDYLIDKDDILKKIIASKAEKIEIIVNALDETITKVDSYKKKVFEWLRLLEKDMEEYYETVKGKEGLELKDIDAFKDSIMKSMNLVTSGVEEMTRLLEAHIKLLDLAKPSEVKIDKLQATVQITQTLNNIEKLGYILVKPENEEFKEQLEKAEKEGKVRVFKQV